MAVVSGEGQTQDVSVQPGHLKSTEDFWPETREHFPDCLVNHVFLKAN